MMLGNVNISKQLEQVRDKARGKEDDLISEANRILTNDLFTSEKVLQHLASYSKRGETLEEEVTGTGKIFSPAEIKTIATRHRLKFLSSKQYKPEMPYEATLKTEALNKKYGKDLKHLFVLSYASSFEKMHSGQPSLLFAQTNHGNYFPVHRWGKRIPVTRRWLYWPLRNFETLLATVICFTLLLTLVLPTSLITLDAKATYWSGYRAAAFMHLLIFNAGITTYITLAFTRNFSDSVWNRKSDFG